MGREIRRAPPGWQHPKFKPEEVTYEWQRDAFHPQHDKAYEDALREWLDARSDWEAGHRPDYFDAATDSGCTFEEWYGEAPNSKYYRQERWTDSEATHLAVYETVSEGAPVTPFFATPEELVNYLVANGDFWDQRRGEGGWPREHAEAFVKAGWAPSMVIQLTDEQETNY